MRMLELTCESHARLLRELDHIRDAGGKLIDTDSEFVGYGNSPGGRYKYTLTVDVPDVYQLSIEDAERDRWRMTAAGGVMRDNGIDVREIGGAV